MLYDLLPERIGSIPVGEIKKFVNKEQFAAFVERTFQDLDFRYHGWLDELDKAFERWRTENEISSADANKG